MKLLRLRPYHLCLLVILTAPRSVYAAEAGSGHILKGTIHESIESATLASLMSGETIWWEDTPSGCFGQVTPSPAILMHFAGRNMECRDLSVSSCCDDVRTQSEERACRFVDGAVDDDDWRILP